MRIEEINKEFQATVVAPIIALLAMTLAVILIFTFFDYLMSQGVGRWSWDSSFVRHEEIEGRVEKIHVFYPLGANGLQFVLMFLAGLTFFYVGVKCSPRSKRQMTINLEFFLWICIASWYLHFISHPCGSDDPPSLCGQFTQWPWGGIIGSILSGGGYLAIALMKRGAHNDPVDEATGSGSSR